MSTYSAMKPFDSSAWLILQDWKAGSNTQSLALAKELKFNYNLHMLSLPFWYYWFPPQVISNYIAEKLYHSFTHPPAGVIGTGRSASYGLLAARQKWPSVPLIQIQNPRLPPDLFNYMIVPEHDGLQGDNIITTMGSLGQVNDTTLQAVRHKWQEKLSRYPSPRVTVLIGGNNKYVRLHSDWVDDLIAKCYALLERGMSLFITVSRRTPEHLRARLHAAFPRKGNVWFYDGLGENPYLAFLTADYILVTADSVNMVSEALSTRAPVALLRVPGEGRKFTHFYDALFKAGLTHWYEGEWEITSRPQLRETERVATLLRTKLNLPDA